MRSINIVLAGLLSMSTLTCAYAQHGSEADQEQRFLEFKAFISKVVGPNAVVSPGPFGRALPQSALTTIAKDAKDDDPRAFAANIVPRKDGAVLGFLDAKECTPTAPSVLEERFIKVDGQKITAYYACRPDGETGKYVSVYLPKSPEAKAFVHQRFQLVAYVFVQLEQFTVPFSTVGFEQAWKSADGTAL